MFFNSWLATIMAVAIGIGGAYGTLWFFKNYGQRRLSKRESVALWFLTVTVLVLSVYALTTDFGRY
jgi:Kef-type K+ transport system membrane component KefB